MTWLHTNYLPLGSRVPMCSWMSMIPKYIQFVWKVALPCAALACSCPAKALEPIPSFYQDPGLSPNRDYVNQQMNEHIDPFTGKLQLHYIDLFIPGNGGLDIKVQRSYNSQDELLTEPTVLGVGWTMRFGRVLRRSILDICDTNTKARTAPVLELPDGSRQILYPSLDQSFRITTNRFKSVCSPSGTGLTVSSPDGTTYEMTTPGLPLGESPTSLQNSYYTTRIIDRNGNTLNFSYTTVGAITSVSQINSGDGRTVTFSYAGGVLSTVSDGTRTWTYTYDTSEPNFPFLTEVKRPDGQTWKYSYNLTPGPSAGAFSMNQLTYPTGGTLSYSYGFVEFNVNLPRTTVVTQKIGVGGPWTFSYNPATTMATLDSTGTNHFTDDSMMDRTVITAPDSVRMYFHVGANSINSGAVYAIGLLLYEAVGVNFQTGAAYQLEGHFWDVDIISNTINQRPGTPWISDGAIGATKPLSQIIVRNGQSYSTAYGNYDAFANAGSIAEQGTTTNGAQDVRNTTKSYNVLTGKWILHLPKDETTDTIGTINRTYDGNGNLLSENKYGVATTFTYTPTGDIASKKDARNNTISYSQYKRGIPQSEVHPEGVNIARVVDDFGNVTSQTDGEGATTGYAYDGLNRLTSITHPIGNPVTITWGQTTRVVQRGPFREFTSFDAYGRKQSLQLDGSASGSIVQSCQYDPVNRKVFESYFNQPTGTLYTYDPLGRIALTGHVAQPGLFGFTVNGGTRTSTFLQNTVKNTNERGLQYVMNYRGYGTPDHLDLMQIAAPDPAANTVLTRNGLGQPLTIAQGGQTRSNVYDTRFFLTQALNPEIGATLYGRDEVGNMISRQLGTSGITTYAYDGRNRLTSIQYPTGTPSVTKTYFRDDLVRSVDNGLARRDYVYSPNKTLTSEALAVGTTNLSVNYAYDGNDALSSMAYSTGLTIAYNPDGLGRPTQVLPFASSVAFQPNGLLRQIAYVNGVVGTFAINDRQWPSNVTYAQSNGFQYFNLTNLYDFSGNVTSIDEIIRGQLFRTLSYDPLDRLSGITTPDFSNGTLTYDGNGNLLSQHLGTTNLSYQYDATNKLSSVSGSRSMNFSYDVYGDVTANSRNQFTYDDAQTLRCVDCGTSNEIDYVYDGLGTRVSEQRQNLTTTFMYGSHGNLLFEVDSNGVKREYGYVSDRNIGRKVSQ